MREREKGYGEIRAETERGIRSCFGKRISREGAGCCGNGNGFRRGGVCFEQKRHAGRSVSVDVYGQHAETGTVVVRERLDCHGRG